MLIQEQILSCKTCSLLGGQIELFSLLIIMNFVVSNLKKTVERTARIMDLSLNSLLWLVVLTQEPDIEWQKKILRIKAGLIPLMFIMPVGE